MAKKLTPKQEKFCLAYVETGNASEAYRQAYAVNGKSENAVHVEASRLLSTPKISLRVSKLQEAHRKRHDVTVDGLSENLELAMKLAFQNKQAAAMVSAIMGRAKLHGLLVDRAELTGKDGGPIVIDDMARLKAMSPEERKARIEELIGKRDAA